MKLIIGAGTRTLPGFKTHDVQDLPGIDYVCNFWELPLYVKPGTCEEIHMTHVLEHFPMKETDLALEYVYGLLKDGGKLYLEVPNFYWHCEQIMIDPKNRQMIEYAFGGQLNEWDYHYNGFTPQILREDLKRASFIIDSLAPNSSIEVWCHK